MWTNRPDSTWNSRSELKIASSFDRLQGSEQSLELSSEQHSRYGHPASSNSHTYSRWNTDLQSTTIASEKSLSDAKAADRLTDGSTSVGIDHNLGAGSYAVNVQSVVTTGVSSTISLPVATTTNAGDWFSQTLHDANLSNLVRSLYSDDGMISRTDMITTFRAVEQDNVVSTYEFSDLRTLVADGNLLHMTDSVQILSAKVVGDNAANVFFQGNHLGDLYAGSSGGQLEKLVDKWFFGSDRPANDVPAYSETPERYINYGWASGSLFGNDGSPQITDIHQGYLGDCYFLASLGATLLQHPSAIQNMFTDNGDGTFTVRLFAEQDGVSQTRDYVTVDRYLPSNIHDNGSTVSQRFAYYDNQNVGLWVALAEKAYAQFAEEGVSQRNNSNPNGTGLGYVPNSYSSIEGGFGYRTMPSLSGRNAGHWDRAPTLQTIASALSQGYAMTADTVGSSDSHIDSYTHIVMNHEYVVVSANLSNSTLTLYNPWGDNNNSVGNSGVTTGDVSGYKTISYSDFVNYDLAAINYC